MLLQTILSLADGIIRIAAIKIQRKYIEEYNDLKMQIREEEAKPRAQQSDAVLDNLKFRLCLVVNTIAAEAGKPDA